MALVNLIFSTPLTEPLGGRREVLVKDRHTRLEWAQVVAHIVENMYPEAEKIILVQLTPDMLFQK